MSHRTTYDIQLDDFALAEVGRIEFVFYKWNTTTEAYEVWDLSGGSVTLTFEKPDRSTQFTVNMTELTDGTDGVFYYDTTTATLDTVGPWTCTPTVTDGTVSKHYPFEIGFNVNEQP